MHAWKLAICLSLVIPTLQARYVTYPVVGLTQAKLTDMASELQSLDLSKLLAGHALLSILAALGSSPIYNLPLALFGMIVTTIDAGDDGSLIQTFTGLFGATFFIDAIWLLSYDAGRLAWFFIVVNWLLKPITLLTTLGRLRQRGHATFDLPGGFTLPGQGGGAGSGANFGGFPPSRTGAGGNETMWQAPSGGATGGGGSYHERSYSDVERAVPVAPAAQAPRSVAPPAATNTSVRGLQGEGGGYHTLE